MKIKCLIVDDEPAAREILQQFTADDSRLELAAVCSNAFEANDILQKEKIDLLFLDINMPGLTGLEALPKIMEIDPDAVVMMLTGHASRHLVEGSAKAGATHYIRKDTPQQEITNMFGMPKM